jgi:hypothetical protein
MKKLFSLSTFVLLTTCLLSSLHSQAQFLTKRQTFDHQVGDVIQYSYDWTSNFQTTFDVRRIADSIMSKTVSQNQDTITYVKLRREKMIFLADTNYVVIEIITGNLDDSMFLNTYNLCLEHDTVFSTDACGIASWKAATIYDPNCFEPVLWSSTAYHGLGYYKSYGNIEGGYAWHLDGSNTTRYGNCGTPHFSVVNFSNYVSLNEQHQAGVQIRLYPNPAQSILHIEHSGDVVYELHSIGGKLKTSGKLTIDESEINIEDLSAGVYVMKVIQNKMETKHRVVIK